MTSSGPETQHGVQMTGNIAIVELICSAVPHINHEPCPPAIANTLSSTHTNSCRHSAPKQCCLQCRNCPRSNLSSGCKLTAGRALSEESDWHSMTDSKYTYKQLLRGKGRRAGNGKEMLDHLAPAVFARMA